MVWVLQLPVIVLMGPLVPKEGQRGQLFCVVPASISQQLQLTAALAAGLFWDYLEEGTAAQA